ncbi:hypothetical protein BV898_11534 [Hypsibius exemplaris]|uniref:Chitin-binding type-2 domain-containing protein n=1 Tax=Hypsibius exemplaris TaxID=2072580 RepID=A0A1W0WGH3_HYPEX|nr:hypothetical protein BV898_11534 [Hypsibius exemplaris]
MQRLATACLIVLADILITVNGETKPVAHKISVSGNAFSSTDQVPLSKSLPIDSKAAIEFAALTKAVLVKTPVNGVPGTEQFLNYLSGGADLVAVKMAKKPVVPGVDYPVLSQTTDVSSFSCWDVQLSGFYADIDSRCQIFRFCDINGREYAFLCPNTTVFNQVLLVCDYWYNVVCERSAYVAEWANSHIIGPLPIQWLPPLKRPCAFGQTINCLLDPCDKKIASCPRYPNAVCRSNCCQAYWFLRNGVEVTGQCHLPLLEQSLLGHI